MNNERIEAWHFLKNNKRFSYDDGNIAQAGYVYSVKGPIKLCKWGLHASEKALDALTYAPGEMIGRVVLSGKIIHGDDKLVATHREYLWIADATETLRSFARWSALQVIHLWESPSVVREYLESGDEYLRSAAESAAWNAVWGAARSAAWSAAESAARSAAKSAARNAAWSAVWGAARSAAWSAAESAARNAAWNAVWGAAKSAAWNVQNTELHNRLMELAPK